MEIEKEVLDFIIQVLTNGPLLLALICWVGHVLKGSSIREQLTGAAKAAIGVIALSAGANLLVGVLTPFQTLLAAATGLKGFFPGCYAMYANAMTIAEVTRIFGLVLVGGFLLHLVIARLTRFKYVFLTPHGFLWMVTAVTIPLANLKVDYWVAIAIGTIITGVYYTYSCVVAHYDFKGITGGEKVTIGHPGGTTYFLAGLLGRFFKGTSKSDEVKMPKGFGWMRDITLSTSFVMLILLAVAVLLVPPGKLEVMGMEVAMELNPVLWVIVNAVTFGAGILVLMTGVRLMLREITVSFEGISRKVIPGGTPGLDCPVSFPFSEASVMLGFIGGVIGSVITSISLVAVGWMFIIPPVVECFFMAGTCGVYGNYKGGWKGSLAGGFMKGVALVVLPALSASFTMAYLGVPITHADADACLVTILTYLLLRALGYT